MFFTGLREKFIKKTGVKSAGYISIDNESKQMHWYEAHYKADLGVWSVSAHSSKYQEKGWASQQSHETIGACTYKDALKALKTFEDSPKSFEFYDIWHGDRNLDEAERILKDQKYSLRHRIMNAGLPKL